MPREIHRITDQFALVKRKGSQRWNLEWREGGKVQRRATGCADLEPALDRARELILAGARLHQERPADIGVMEVLDRYRLNYGKDLASAATVARACKLWALFWGERALVDVTCTEVDRFTRWLYKRRLAQGYVRRVLSVGKAAIARAFRLGELQQAPHIQLPPHGEAYPHYATREQLVTLLNAAMPDHVWTYILIRLCTGCRGDAALDLQPFQVDRHARLVRLNPPGRQQTKKRRPVVPLCDALAAHLGALPASAFYVNWHGERIHTIRMAWNELRDACGLPKWFIPKVLRHTVATELRRRGVSGWEASGLLGHKTGGTTDTYAKFDPAYLGQVRHAIDAWMVDLSADVPTLRSVVSGVVSSAGSETKEAPLAQGLRLVQTPEKQGA